MKYNPDSHHRKSTRLPDYDYSQHGVYFVTICIQGRRCLFGEIIDGDMQINELGETASRYWKKIETLHPFFRLGEFIIMPNHIHGIIFIENEEKITDTVGATHRAARKNDRGISEIHMHKKSISSVINHYKGAVKKWANKNEYEYFSWQRNYHEHIIRDEKSLEMISEYIMYNPVTWKDDKFFTM